MKTPLVSVIYPVYNDLPRYIHESMDSIVNQDYANLQIIVIDDSTVGESIEALNQYTGDPRVQILRGPKTSGLPSALNSGLALARGKYIARADADDIQCRDRIRSQVEFLEENQSIGILGCNVNYIDQNGKRLKTRIFPETDKSIRRHLHLRNPLCHSVVMIRKDVFDKIGVYDTSFKRAEDYELWLRASANDIHIHNLQKVLLDYRMATGSKRDWLNWHMNLKLKKQYFSMSYIFESIAGISLVYLYAVAPMSLQNFIYKKLA